MRLRAGDVFGVEALIEIDRGIDAAHDLRRAAGKATAPQRIRSCAGRGIDRLLPDGHWPPFRALRRDQIMKSACAAALILLLVAPGVGSAAEGDAAGPHATQPAEVRPASPPFLSP